jgi:hypothetical protein
LKDVGRKNSFDDCHDRGCQNGNEGISLDVWVWPSGFRHYVADHEIRPTAEFDRFVREWAQESSWYAVQF